MSAIVDVAPYVGAVVILAAGLYGIVTSRHLVHTVVCVSVLQSSTYVLLVAVGYRRDATAPIFDGIATDVPVVDPVVQAVTLTNVVVSSVVIAILLALVVQAQKRWGSVDPAELRAMRG